MLKFIWLYVTIMSDGNSKQEVRRCVSQTHFVLMWFVVCSLLCSSEASVVCMITLKLIFAYFCSMVLISGEDSYSYSGFLLS